MWWKNLRVKIGSETAHPVYFFMRWLSGWATIAEGVVAVVTLGFVWPNWSTQILTWQMLWEIGNKVD